MKRDQLIKPSLLLMTLLLFAGCGSDGDVRGYASTAYSYGYYDRDYYYRGDVIVRPPAYSRPKPENPIYKPRPPVGRPTPHPLPSRPLPVPRPMRR